MILIVFKNKNKNDKGDNNKMVKGNKVIVIELENIDKEDTNLKIGSIGKIINDFPDLNDMESKYDVFSVKFDKDFKCHNLKSDNLNNDGSYIMCRYQLQVI